MLWWDTSDFILACKTPKVRITKTLAILPQKKKLRSLSTSMQRINDDYRASLHEKCLKHHGHKGDLGLRPETCGIIGERAQVILM
jgi:hypothetical protein